MIGAATLVPYLLLPACPVTVLHCAGGLAGGRRHHEKGGRGWQRHGGEQQHRDDRGGGGSGRRGRGQVRGRHHLQG